MLKVFYELKFSGKLPSPAGVGIRILQITQNENCGLDEITNVVRSDPALTGRILKVANSFSTGVPSSAAPLEEAVLRIGFAALRDLVLGFSLISNNRRSVCRSFDFAEFWHRSLGRAVAAQYVTERSGRGGGSESYVCGLLCEMGRLGLATAHPDRYSALLDSPEATDSEAIAIIEAREFGIDHRQLTEALLVDWGFPSPLAHGAATFRLPEVSDDTDPTRFRCLRQTLRLAEGIVSALDAHATSAADVPADVLAGLAEFDIPEDEIEAALASIQTIRKEWGALLNLAPIRPVLRGAKPSTPPAGELPVDAMPGRKTGKPIDPKPAPPAGAPLLLFEANDRMAADFEGWLQPAGFAVHRARSVPEALRLAVAHTPQIVIARGNADDTEALELCRALRTFEEGRNTFFILATPNERLGRLLATFDAGVDDHLVLPLAEGAGLLRIRAAQRFVELRGRVVAQEKTLQLNLADLAVANRKLHRAAMTDDLTQLPNRRYAEETMREAWITATLQEEHLSLILGDIDHFKLVNDQHGHLVGDMVLLSVARLLRRELRSSDIACRVGGEEFLVICPNTDLQGARICAERIRQRMVTAEIEVSGTKHRMTISLGIASRRNLNVLAPTVESLLKAADDAVYASKRAGRNRVSIGQVAQTAVFMG